jgi:NAD(P)H-dependent FMN reductase
MSIIGIVSGSHRQVSQSAKVSGYIEKQLLALGENPVVFSLAKNPFPLWNESIRDKDETWERLWKPVSQQLAACEGFVIISPEWSGMVPAGLKNFFLLCGKNELAHKPGLIVTVSTSIGGAYPVAELRMSSYKNTRICYIPDHVIVRTAEKMLNSDEPADDHDRRLRERIQYSLKVLGVYTKAFGAVRGSEAIDLKRFPYGM